MRSRCSSLALEGACLRRVSGVTAAARLNVDLHQRPGKVRTQSLLGEYDDATEASEVVMLADLLMRILDRL